MVGCNIVYVLAIESVKFKVLTSNHGFHQVRGEEQRLSFRIFWMLSEAFFFHIKANMMFPLRAYD